MGRQKKAKPNNYNFSTLQQKSPAQLGAELETLIQGMTEETYDQQIIDAYLNVLQQKEPINFNFDVTPVLSSSGERVVVHMRSSLRTSVRVKNSDMLIMDYMNNGIVSAERRAESVLGDCLKRA